MMADRIAQNAQLSMLLELSSSPKPGNIDRCHDFGDMSFQQFVISAVSAYPVFRRAALGEVGVGALILEAVKAWREWGLSGNTHFGSLTLLIPLAMAAGKPGTLEIEIKSALESTTVADAVDFYRAFDLAGARVADIGKFSLKDKTALDALKTQGKTLLDLMKLSKDHDLVAREWSTAFQRSFHLSKALRENVSRYGLNCGVVRTFLLALSEVPDSLIQAKFGEKVAHKVSARAALALEDEGLSTASNLDRELLMEDINPGSTADLIAASLFIALTKGLRF